MSISDVEIQSTRTKFDDEGKHYGVGIRHIQVACICACSVTLFVARACMAVAVLAMTDNTKQHITTFDWDKRSQGMVLSSFFWGYLAMQVPSGVVARRRGGKPVVAAALAVNGLISFALPALAKLGGWRMVCVCRACMGLTQAGLFPYTHTLLARWVPPRERTTCAGLIYGERIPSWPAVPGHVGGHHGEHSGLRGDLQPRTALRWGLSENFQLYRFVGFCSRVHLIVSGHSRTLGLAVALLIATLTISGGTSAGCLVNHLDLSPQYAGLLQALTNSAAGIGSVLTPLLTSVLLKNDPTDISGWRCVFLWAAAFCVATNLVYLMYGTSQRQLWDNPDETSLNPDETLPVMDAKQLDQEKIKQ